MNSTNSCRNGRDRRPSLIPSISSGIAGLIVCALLISAVPLWGQDEPSEASAQEEEPAQEEAQEEESRSILEDWRDTLRFGINSQVVELIPTLRDERVTELEPEVRRLLENSRNESVQEEILGYYRALELPQGQAQAVAFLEEYQVGTTERTQGAINYLADVPPEERELRARIGETLAEIIDQGGPQIAASAARQIGTYEEQIGIDRMVELFNESVSPDVRAAIILSLGDMANPEAFDFLVDIAEDDANAMILRQYAVDSLGKLGIEEAVPVISELLGADNSLLRAYAVSALGRFENEEAADALMTALRDEFWRARVFALQGIARLEIEEAVPAVLYKVRSDPEERVRLEAVKTLEAFRNGEVRGFVEETVTDPRAAQPIRLAMVDLLLEWGDPEAISTIEAVMAQEWSEEDSRILDRIGKEASRRENEAFAPLYEKMLTHSNFIIRIYGARGIGRNRLSGYRERLEAMTEEGNHPAVQQNARRALERL